MSTIVKGMKVVENPDKENDYLFRIFFRCDTCEDVWWVDHSDKKEADIFVGKIKKKEPVIEAVCKNCNHIINLN